MMKKRYERGATYIEYTLIADNAIGYTCGVVGFGSENGATGVLTYTQFEEVSRTLLNDGYCLVDAPPLSEEGGADGGVLLDWVGGITR